MMRILITGSRDWVDRNIVHRGISEWVRDNVPVGETSILVHGDATRGVDRMGRDFARAMWWLEEEPHPADWSWGKSAGMHRNSEMVARGADVCLAFIRIGSPGATHCAREAAKSGIPLIRYLDNDGVLTVD